MADELAWRKFPRSAISSAELDYISFTMAPNEKQAPYMFFMTMFCRCDDNGVFDLEDGVIFARLMRIENTALVFKIAELMTQRRILTRIIPNEQIFMITDWDPPERRNNYISKTMEERRAAVANKIMEERKRAQAVQAPEAIPYTPPFTVTSVTDRVPQAAPATPAEPQPSVTVTVSAEQRAKILAEAFGGAVFSGAEPSPTNFFDLKTTKNENLSSKQREREKEIDTERDKKEIGDTHTQEIRERERDQRAEREEQREAKQAPANLKEASASFAEENTQEQQEDTQDTEGESIIEMALTKAEAEKVEKNKQDENEYLEVRSSLRSYAEEYFIKNCLGFNAEANSSLIEKVCRQVFKLRSAKNPPQIILQTILKTFGAMSADRNSHYHDTPLTPEYLLKPGIWAHVLHKAGTILITSNENKEAWAAQMQEVSDAESLAVENDITERCKKYGIDPASPNRLSALMRVESFQGTG